MGISNEFKRLRKNDNAVIEALNELSEDKLIEIRSYLATTSGEKINRIRGNVLEYLCSNKSITKEVVEEIKSGVNDSYSTDIVRSWKSYFSLFYIFFYCGIRVSTRKHLKDLSINIKNDLQLTEFSASKEVGFDGATNFGADSAWLAIYNKRQPNQSSSLQLFVNFSYPEVSYGLFEFYSPAKYLTKEVVDISDFNYENMVKFLSDSRSRIIDDSKPINTWKLSPGESAVYWKEMKEKGIASIGWGDYDFSGLTKFQIGKLDTEYFNKHTKSAGIIGLMNKARSGDIIYAFKGRKEIIGKGVVRGESLYSKDVLIDGSDHHNYLVVDWEESFLKDKKLEKMVSMDAFANISSRRQELEKITFIDQEEVSDGQGTKQGGDEMADRSATNQILYGPPGTGKTYSTVDLALKIIKEDLYFPEDRESNLNEYARLLEKGQIVFTTFHQSYGYEDFVEGIKVKSEGGVLTYEVEPGIFKALCEDADGDPLVDYVIIVDEINRGNISKIFGELITLIEPDKRKGAEEEISVKLPYSKNPFSVPKNVHILGTMNTADASIAKLDVALRRRFNFIEMEPKPELLTDTKTKAGEAIVVEGINLIKLLTSINERIELLYDREHTIGHSFFMELSSESSLANLKNVFTRSIIPLLQEYFFDDWKRIHTVLDCLKDPESTSTHFVKKKYGSSAEDLKKLMGNKWVSDDGNESNDVWELNTDAFDLEESYISIYLQEKKNTAEPEKEEA